MASIDELLILADDNNIIIDSINLSTKKATAINIDGDCFIGMSNIIDDYRDYRDNLAEEIGHCVTNSFYALNSPPQLLETNVAQAERRACDWAIKFLFPFNKLMEIIEYNLGDLYQVADYFNSSLAMVNNAIEFYQRKGILIS